MDCFIFDCDGVIWRGDSVIDGVPETLDMLRAMVRLGGRWLPARRLGPCLAQAAGVCASYRCLQALAAKLALFSQFSQNYVSCKQSRYSE